MAPAPVAPTLPVPFKASATDAAKVFEPVRSPARLSVMVGLVMSPFRVSDEPVRVTEVPVVRLPVPMTSASLAKPRVLREVTFRLARVGAVPPLMVTPPLSRLLTVTLTPPVVPRLRLGVALVTLVVVLLFRFSWVPAFNTPTPVTAPELARVMAPVVVMSPFSTTAAAFSVTEPAVMAGSVVEAAVVVRITAPRGSIEPTAPVSVMTPLPVLTVRSRVVAGAEFTVKSKVTGLFVVVRTVFAPNVTVS